MVAQGRHGAAGASQEHRRTREPTGRELRGADHNRNVGSFRDRRPTRGAVGTLLPGKDITTPIPWSQEPGVWAARASAGCQRQDRKRAAIAHPNEERNRRAGCIHVACDPRRTAASYTDQPRMWQAGGHETKGDGVSQAPHRDAITGQHGCIQSARPLLRARMDVRAPRRRLTVLK